MDLFIFIISFTLILLILAAFVVGVFAARKTTKIEDAESRKIALMRKIEARARQSYAKSKLRAKS